MLRTLVVLIVVLAAIGLAAFAYLTTPAMVPASALGLHTPDLANGKTVFHAGGCASCHATPRQDDKTRLGGGLALKSPFGTFYVPNISPHPTDGIGTWTEADFVTAVTKGTSQLGEHYYPAFPYTSYQRAKIGDVRDMFAHLKTLPPVQGRVRDHDLPFPFNIRRGLGLWKWLYLDGKTITPDPSKPEAWNRGAYLVNALVHCAECHSPRDFIGGIIEGQRFAGGPSPDGQGWVPNITQKALAKWSEKDIAYLLETGDLPDGDSVGGDMVAVVRSTAQLPAADRAAMATYIKSLPPVDGPLPPSKK
ncbi:MAG: c-type cytochrome [Rhizobiales bacterium]|nr:c-type cytochrome [Hyphomicrobiales bacterium]